MISNVAIIGSVVVSAMGAIFGLYQARKADKSASTTKTIELGVKDLIDQYQEANKDLREQANDCTAKCKALETQLQEQTHEHKALYEILENELREVKTTVDSLKTVLDDRDSEIIRLKLKLGEPLDK